MVSRCPQPTKPAGRHRFSLVQSGAAAKVRVLTVDEETGLLLLPKTYTTRHGQLVLFAEDALVEDTADRTAMQPQAERAAASREEYVDKLLKQTFDGNLLYLAASILVFGDQVSASRPALEPGHLNVTR